MFSRFLKKKEAKPPQSSPGTARDSSRATNDAKSNVAEGLHRALAHHRAGQYVEAEQVYLEVLAADPDNFDALHLLGLVAHQTGDSQRGAALIARAVDINSSNAAALNNLAEIYRTLGRIAEAQASCERALLLQPGYADAHCNLGIILEQQSKPQQARACYEQALLLKPEFAPALAGLGGLFKTEGDLDKARACYERALLLQPTLVGALNNLGAVLAGLGRRDEAIDCYRKTLELDPGIAEAHCNLGNLLRESGRLADAVASYQRAIEIQPKLAQAHYGLGHVLADQDRTPEALGAFQAAILIDPGLAEARWAYAMSQLPWIYDVDADPNQFRSAFARELHELDAWFDLAPGADGSEAVGVQQPFMLAYQEWDNRELLEVYGNLCARLMQRWLERQEVPGIQRKQGGQLRIGVVSTHIRNHSQWHAIVKGWFQHLDPSRFELQAFYLKSQSDSETAFAKERAAYFEQGDKTLKQWVELILARQPDVLIYPEIGTDPMPLKLASLRLAPVQVAAWGHPLTTGLPTIDYFASAHEYEVADAQAHYTERLVSLPHLGCSYSSLAPDLAEPPLAELGIDPTSPLLLCPGTPFKYAPQFDWVLTEIARRLGKCRFMFFFESTYPYLTAKLRKRLTIVFDRAGLDLVEHVVFAPALPRPQFFGLMKRAHVYLDTIGFSGFNTAMQAIECGLPIVTREGHFMRGRLASGVLKRMSMSDLVTRTEQEYVDLAVKLAQDSDYRHLVRQRIEASRHILFDDEAPIRALEDFLVKAVEQRRQSS